MRVLAFTTSTDLTLALQLLRGDWEVAAVSGPHERDPADFDVVVVDLADGADGAVRDLRRRWPDVPRLVVGAMRPAVGADAWLARPFTVEELRERIAELAAPAGAGERPGLLGRIGRRLRPSRDPAPTWSARGPAPGPRAAGGNGARPAGAAAGRAPVAPQPAGATAAGAGWQAPARPDGGATAHQGTAQDGQHGAAHAAPRRPPREPLVAPDEVAGLVMPLVRVERLLDEAPALADPSVPARRLLEALGSEGRVRSAAVWIRRSDGTYDAVAARGAGSVQHGRRLASAPALFRALPDVSERALLLPATDVAVAGLPGVQGEAVLAVGVHAGGMMLAAVVLCGAFDRDLLAEVRDIVAEHAGSLRIACLLWRLRADRTVVLGGDRATLDA